MIGKMFSEVWKMRYLGRYGVNGEHEWKGGVLVTILP